MNQKIHPNRALPQMPKKWAAVVLVAFVAYTLVQPTVNRTLGWSLPSLASLTGQGSNSTTATSTKEPRGKPADPYTAPNTAEATNPVDSSPLDRNADDSNATSRDTKLENPQSQELKYGFLREVAREDFQSPGGLRYTRGSEEGHRLIHLERHLEDQPDRPGSHGVFYGDMPQILRWLDDAYARGKAGAKGTQKKHEDGRDVFEVPFDTPIGYVGGKDGARKGNPDTKRLRMVLEGERVITAFPF